jgi:hypothetical protein
MFVKVIDTGVVARFQKETTKKLLLKCDFCSVEFEKRYTKMVLERTHHFCSNDCKFRAQKNSEYSNYRTERIKSSNLKKYGSTMPWASEEGQQRREAVMIEKYGVANAMHMQEVIEKVKLQNQAKFGCDYPLQSQEVRRKALLSYRNGDQIINRSSCELFLETKLIEIFGKENVEAGKIVNGWCIDFYIKSIDSYVQVDGVYWHGLDRPVEEIKSSSLDRDKHILSVWKKDRKQNSYFRHKKMRLLRITDDDLKNSNTLNEFLQMIQQQ